MLLHAGNLVLIETATEVLSRVEIALEVQVGEQFCSSMEQPLESGSAAGLKGRMVFLMRRER